MKTWFCFILTNLFLYGFWGKSVYYKSINTLSEAYFGLFFDLFDYFLDFHQFHNFRQFFYCESNENKLTSPSNIDLNWICLVADVVFCICHSSLSFLKRNSSETYLFVLKHISITTIAWYESNFVWIDNER